MKAAVYDVRPMGTHDEPQVLDLLNLTMAGGPAGAWTYEFFRWKHVDNPFGVSPALVAEHDGHIVGVRLFLRWVLQARGVSLRAVRAIDTATHPDYQRQGIFRTLTMALLEQLDSDEAIDLVFNTPNADSRPGYMRLGWQEVGQLPVHVSPVRPFAFLRGVRGASTANASGSASAVAGTSTEPVVGRRCSLPPAASVFEDVSALQSLLDGVATTSRLHTPKTVEYLRWRYAEVPGLDYRCVPVERSGSLVGLGFGRVRRRANLVEFTLGDVLVREGDERSARRVLRAARRCGADHVALHAAPGSEVAGTTRRSGYLRVPGQGIGLVANPRRDTPVTVLDADAWRLSLGDLEVF